MSYQQVENNRDLEALLGQSQGVDFVAVDTEFMRRDTFYPQAALIQLCFPGQQQAGLIDPLAISDMSPLRRLFENSNIVKVLHSPSEDLEVFTRLLGVLPAPLFDTQKAIAFLNKGHGLGYRGMVEMYTGEELPKGETRSNWLARPLTSSQLDYAAQDVVPLALIYPQLRDELIAAQRLTWLQQDCDDTLAAAGQVPSLPLQRIKSAWKLSPRQLAALSLICDWREERAKTSDKPRSWILSDMHCFELAQRRPKTIEDITAIAEFPMAVVRKQGQQFLGMINCALELPESSLPQKLSAPLDSDQRNQLKLLKTRAREYAGHWNIAPEILLVSKDYELLLRKLNGEKVVEPLYWQGWRRQYLLEPLKAIFTEVSP